LPFTESGTTIYTAWKDKQLPPAFLRKMQRGIHQNEYEIARSMPKLANVVTHPLQKIPL
jgi:hypothetical protein